jgi:hypothetical protein
MWGETQVLSYYKIEPTKEGKEFFYSNLGYFNFWDEYLIANTKESNGKIFWVIVNRTGRNFSEANPSKEQYLDVRDELANSIYLKKPEEMFKDFPELKDFESLKNYSIYSMLEIGGYNG